MSFFQYNISLQEKLSEIILVNLQISVFLGKQKTLLQNAGWF